ncbi:MAG: hypothetical protein E7G36_00140 [Peptoniphilus rhinitidis]|uniref:hypothetical protein n=1 Tax=Peptoniphilus rhinitidis TaxID=1175452 RepID=UPI0028FDE97F|nr:hypothetical protein [Peptoniphilus rhinitidis]MDU2109036.1 hypothetical protein [Peptoniphilus lacydonensis]MDU3750112.1 hypothetical protein [Peptoniphilus rhinitidis]
MKEKSSKDVINRDISNKKSIKINKNKNNRTITFTGDVKVLVEENRKLQKENIKLKEQNQKMKKDFENMAEVSKKIALEAFKEYLGTENTRDYEAIKNIEDNKRKNSLMMLFNNSDDFEEDQLRYKMFKLKENKFINFLNNAIKNRYE